jgi:hypothetical protein
MQLTRNKKQEKNENFIFIFKVQKTPSPTRIIMDMMTDARTGATKVTKIITRNPDYYIIMKNYAEMTDNTS